MKCIPRKLSDIVSVLFCIVVVFLFSLFVLFLLRNIQCRVQSDLFLNCSQLKMSPRVHLHGMGMLRLNELSLSTPVYSVLVSVSVFMALSTVFNFIHMKMKTAVEYN